MKTQKIIYYIVFSILVFISAWNARADIEKTENIEKQDSVITEELTVNNPVFSPSDLVPVVSVVDGDTIIATVKGKNEKIRLIGINTPETVDPRKPVECFGREASAFAKQKLAGNNVALEPDDSQDERDKYGRLLRYVYLPDGTLFNLLMAESGYAYEYTYQTPYVYQADFKEAEALAQEEGRGLWNPSVCPQ